MEGLRNQPLIHLKGFAVTFFNLNEKTSYFISKSTTYTLQGRADTKAPFLELLG